MTGQSLRGTGLATVERSLGPARIDRLDRERIIRVEANTQGRPLSEVVAGIGGVVTSTLLTLLVIPTVYEILCEGRGGADSRPRDGLRDPARPGREPGG